MAAGESSRNQVFTFILNILSQEAQRSRFSDMQLVNEEHLLNQGPNYCHKIKPHTKIYCHIISTNPVEPPSTDLVSDKHSFLWSAPDDFPSEHLLDPKVLQDFAAFLQGHKGRDGLKGEAVAKYLKEYSKGPDTYDVS